MQQYADIYLPLNYFTCFGRPLLPSSGVHKTVVAASGTDHIIWRANIFKRSQIRSQFYVFLMMVAMDARNMYSNLAVNKNVHAVASCWISST